MEIPSDLDPALVPLAWLLGTWRGVGVGGYPTIGDFRFGQELTFSHDGRTFLAYESRSWLLEEDGGLGAPMQRESGAWRVVPPTGDSPGSSTTGSGTELEVVLAHDVGYAEVWTGSAQGPRIALTTDVVARTATAKQYDAGTRLYGLVEGDLLWAFDMAAAGQPLQSHVSGRLKRV